MSIDKVQLKMALQCSSAEELVQKAAEAGCNLSMEQAQNIIDSVEIVELDENDLDMVAGGGDTPLQQKCKKCSSTEFTINPSIGGDWWFYICKGCGQEHVYISGTNSFLTIEEFREHWPFPA